jgi:O-antigen ligase
LLQVAQGPSSSLRFYAFTNTSEAVGFFANRNHYAALLYCLVLVAAAWAIATVADFTRAEFSMQSRHSTPQVIALLVSFTVLVILVAAQAMARSRAGLGLTVVALLGAFALAYRAPTGSVGGGSPTRATLRSARRLLLAAASLAILFGAQFALYRIQARFAADPLADWRLPFARNTIEAAMAYMPFGSGMGTFVPVYQTFEKASDNVASAFANRAHNDFLELWLEAGLVGLIAMGGFLVWVLGAVWRVWRHGLRGADHRDNLMACAAALALVLLLAHATVDYGLRTAALMAVFAWAVSMLLVPVAVQAQVAGQQGADGERGRATTSQRGRAAAHASSRGDVKDPPSHGQVSDTATDKPFVPAPPRDDWPAAWRVPNPKRDE